MQKKVKLIHRRYKRYVKGDTLMSVRERITEECIATYTELVTQKKKLRAKQNKGMTIFFAVCIVFGLALGFFGAMFLDKGIDFQIEPPFRVKEPFDFIYPFVFVIFFYFTMVLHTIIHEGGHLVFGLLTGYRFLSFRVFSFTVVKKDGKTVRKKLKTPGMMGQCLMIPPEWDENEKYPYAWYNLGGGFMNLISCLLVVPLFFFHSPLLAWIAGVFIFSGVIFALSNLIPMSMGIPNDGKNCLLCKKSRENQKAFYLQLKINAMMSDGVLLKDIPEEMFAVGQDGNLNALFCTIRLMEFCRHLQKEDEEEAKACLLSMEQAIEKLPVAFVNSIDLERLYFMLLDKAPLEEIASYYAVLQPVLLQNKDISVLRVKYVYYLLLTDEEREMIDWLVALKKGKLPKKLPKRKPVTAEKIYEDMEKAFANHPVIGEAEIYMSLANKCKEKSVAEQVEAVTEV